MVWGISAGHSSWEQPIHSRAVDSTTSVLNKRAFSIQPRGTLRVWPDATIRYCFENDQTKQQLLYHLEAARDLWYQAGLPEEKYKLTEVSDAVCRDDRANVLLIKYNDQGKLSATPALPPKDDSDPTYQGPTLHLSDKTDVGMLDVVANYAHEMGHVWGLLHEHQNPAFWEYPFSTQGMVNEFQFDCRNLKDYAEVAARLSPTDMEDACKYRSNAAEAKFSAAEFLPILGGGRSEGPGLSPDLMSIMLYPSGAGATGTASPGNDGRADVLLNKDGSKILPNVRPTLRDVEGIKKLYNTDWGTTNPVLLNKPANPKSNKFKDLFKKKKCL